MSDFLITQNCSANLHEGYRGGMGTEQFNRKIETFLYGPGRTDVHMCTVHECLFVVKNCLRGLWMTL